MTKLCLLYIYINYENLSLRTRDRSEAFHNSCPDSIRIYCDLGMGYLIGLGYMYEMDTQLKLPSPFVLLLEKWL